VNRTRGQPHNQATIALFGRLASDNPGRFASTHHPRQASQQPQPCSDQAWLDSWEYVTPFLAFPPEVRRATNAIEALNRQLRKAVKTKGHFPNEDAARKLLYLAILNAVPAWTGTRNWTTALLAFKIHFGDRLPD
jgi:transposase-like protein